MKITLEPPSITNSSPKWSFIHGEKKYVCLFHGEIPGNAVCNFQFGEANLNFCVQCLTHRSAEIAEFLRKLIPEVAEQPPQQGKNVADLYDLFNSSYITVDTWGNVAVDLLAEK